MSAISNEFIPLNFGPEVVAEALTEVSAPTIGEVKAHELPNIQGSGIYEAWVGMVTEAANLPEIEVGQSYVGFILGTALVRLAAGGILPVRNPAVVNHYVSRVVRTPDSLHSDFSRDYKTHPHVLGLFQDTLKAARTQNAAKVVLNVFGDLANPDRPPFELPTPRLAPPSRRSGQSHTVRGSMHAPTKRR